MLRAKLSRERVEQRNAKIAQKREDASHSRVLALAQHDSDWLLTRIRELASLSIYNTGKMGRRTWSREPDAFCRGVLDSEI